ncbi:unnamed protein product [Pleuronectes platessa]|uniref:Uncharacterized protein n=1 Tax=Pleuronectes platessa TaxID=8262 RepID=A0A9N7VXC7_PLEPL|nr:unnamed protein product [Pleuronectes platessa]
MEEPAEEKRARGCGLDSLCHRRWVRNLQRLHSSLHTGLPVTSPGGKHKSPGCFRRQYGCAPVCWELGSIDLKHGVFVTHCRCGTFRSPPKAGITRSLATVATAKGSAAMHRSPALSSLAPSPLAWLSKESGLGALWSGSKHSLAFTEGIWCLLLVLANTALTVTATIITAISVRGARREDSSRLIRYKDTGHAMCTCPDAEAVAAAILQRRAAFYITARRDADIHTMERV